MTSPLLPSHLATRISTMSRRPAGMGAAPPGDVVSLAMGEPSEGTPGPVVEAAVSALRAGRTRYTALAGSPSLRDAIAAHLTARHAAAVTPERVVCTHGASAGIAAAILATVDPGDRVVIPEPTYSLYADHVAMAGGDVEWVANRPDGSVDEERVDAVLPGARMLVLCSPGNPTGTVVQGDVLRRLIDAAETAGTLVLCDEAYSEVVFDGVSFTSSLDCGRSDHVICCQTFSKTYAMTGWRLGYVVAGSELAPAINLVHRTVNGALSTFVQDAGEVALTLPQVDLQALTASYQHRRDLVVTRLRGVEGVEMAAAQGAFYVFARVDAPVTSEELVRRFAEAGVLVRSGREFGPSGEGAFRISFATADDVLERGLDRVEDVLHAVMAAVR